MSSLIELSRRAGLLVADAAEQNQSEALASAVRRVLESIEATLIAANEVKQFEATTSLVSTAPATAEQVKKAARRLQVEIQNQGPNAVQGKAAETLQDACAKHVKKLTTGVRREWSALFSELDSINQLAATLPSSVRSRLQGEIQALRALSVLDPIGDAADLARKLGTDRSDHRAVVQRRLAVLDTDVRAAIEEHADRTSPAVKALLKKASTPAGFSLEDLTDELLVELRASGHLDELVLHRA